MDYFRAVLKSGEISERGLSARFTACWTRVSLSQGSMLIHPFFLFSFFGLVFELVGDVCEANSGNYTAWHHRRFLIQALNKSVKDELITTGGVICKESKKLSVVASP